jgi:hypothetical protein
MSVTITEAVFICRWIKIRRIRVQYSRSARLLQFRKSAGCIIGTNGALPNRTLDPFDPECAVSFVRTGLDGCDMTCKENQLPRFPQTKFISELRIYGFISLRSVPMGFQDGQATVGIGGQGFRVLKVLHPPEFFDFAFGVFHLQIREVAADDLAQSPRNRPRKKSNSEVAAYFEANVGDDT